MKLQHLKDLREDMDIKQRTIAEYLGISQNTSIISANLLTKKARGQHIN